MDATIANDETFTKLSIFHTQKTRAILKPRERLGINWQIRETSIPLECPYAEFVEVENVSVGRNCP